MGNCSIATCSFDPCSNATIAQRGRVAEVHGTAVATWLHDGRHGQYWPLFKIRCYGSSAVKHRGVQEVVPIVVEGFDGFDGTAGNDWVY